MSRSLDYHFSEELINHIISLVGHRASLASICRVSKRLNRIATAHLYANVTLGSDDRKHHFAHGLEYIQPFTFLMWSSPKHASLVRSLSSRDIPIDPTNSTYLSESTKKPWPHHPALEKILEDKVALHWDSLEEQAEVFEKLKAGDSDCLVLALLLPSLPNLQKLDLLFDSIYTVGNNRLLDMLSRLGERQRPFQCLPSNAIFSLPPFQNPQPLISLTDFFVTGPDEKYPNGVQFFGAAFNLPNLRRLYGWKQGENEADDADDSFKNLRPKSCPVEYIEARTSKFHPKELELMLKAAIPGRLKTFNYEVGCTWAWVNVKHAEINAALAPHYETLEALGLSHEEFYPYQFDNDADQPDPMSFLHFTALRKLKLAPVYIWGQDGLKDSTSIPSSGIKDPSSMLWRALPSTLRQLWIARAQHEPTTDEDFIPRTLIPALEQVAEYKNDRFPDLRNIRIEFPLPVWNDEWLKDLARAASVIRSYGIEVTFILEELGLLDWREQPDRDWGWDEELDFRECWANGIQPKWWVDARDMDDIAAYFINLKEEHAKAKKEAEERREEASRQAQRKKDEESGSKAESSAS